MPQTPCGGGGSAEFSAGPRMQFEFEQLLPGGEDPDASDAILDAIELRDRGHPDRARALRKGLIKCDVRCLTAHSHLGGLAFDQDDLTGAQAHYANGVRIAEDSLPDGFGDQHLTELANPRPAVLTHAHCLISSKRGHSHVLGH
jgi:hypothetical protein